MPETLKCTNINLCLLYSSYKCNFKTPYLWGWMGLELWIRTARRGEAQSFGRRSPTRRLKGRIESIPSQIHIRPCTLLALSAYIPTYQACSRWRIRDRLFENPFTQFGAIFYEGANLIFISLCFRKIFFHFDNIIVWKFP